MLRNVFRNFLCAAAVAVAVTVLAASRADAGWYHWGSYCGVGYGYHAAYYTPVYYSSCYRSPCVTSYRWSCYRPLIYPAYRTCCWPRYRSCYTSWYSTCYAPCYSSCCSPCYSSCSCAYCCGTAIGCCTGTATSAGKVIVDEPAAPVESQPADSAQPTPAPPEPASDDTLPPMPAEDESSEPAADASSSPLPDPGPVNPTPPTPAPPAPAAGDAPADTAPKLDLPSLPSSPTLPPTGDDANNRSRTGSAILSVVVPDDAKVYINGMLTSTPGTYRRYVSHGLVPGFQYTYEIEAVASRKGRLIRDSQVVNVRAGETRDLALNLNVQPSQSAVATVLTVHVPEDAEVQLEGRTASATGATRRFSTLELPKGEQWDEYRVVATIHRNGQPVRQEKTIRMVGGQSHELRFDFPSEQLALR